MFCHMFHLQRRASKTLSTKVTICSVSSEVYVALLNLLKGHSVPKKERTAPVIAAYRYKIETYCIIYYSNESLELATNKKILLKKDEVPSCINRPGAVVN